MANTSSSSSSSSPPIAVKDVVHKLQLCLLEGIKSETQLIVAGSLLSKSDYHDVVTERSIAQMCGYPLCPNSLSSPSPSEPQKKGRYRISLKEHKVYDLTETRMYCSTKCIVDSLAYAESLQEERTLVLDTAKLDKVVRLFDGFGLKGEEGLGENGDFGLSKLSIKEKEDASVGANLVSMEEWIGPSNAIEGYVPHHNRSSKNSHGSKLKDSKLKKEEVRIFNEMDFMSSIITQDNEYSISKESSSQSQTKKINPANKSKPPRNKNKKKATNDTLTIKADSSQAESSHIERVDNGTASVCDKKSSMKSSTSGETRKNRHVTWADDDSKHNNNQIITNYEFSGLENENRNKIENEKEDEDAFRLESAEACALALSQAAEAVASGEIDVPDAVSEAGIVILPPPNPIDDDSKVIAPEPVGVKWPLKNGIVESDFFDSEDSWFDSPPEEFVLDLSPFANMFMSIFAWVSSSTLAYVYGRDDSFHHEYATVNGKEYPSKIVLSDGRSSEIKQTLGGCLARAIPGLVRDLRLPTPVSTIEYHMGCLLDTMSFVDPLPPLRMKQWQVFVLLFVEALSVSRITAVAQHLTNKRRFFQKVFDDGQISTEEYEVLKDVILPLGRLTQFSTQSGG